MIYAWDQTLNTVDFYEIPFFWADNRNCLLDYCKLTCQLGEKKISGISDSVHGTPARGGPNIGLTSENLLKLTRKILILSVAFSGNKLLSDDYFFTQEISTLILRTYIAI